MPYQTRLCSIRTPLPHFQMLVTLVYWYALLFAPIWVASQFHISEPIRDGYVCAMDQSMISSVVLDKVQHKQTCHISTTRYMDQFYALKSRSSLTSLLSTCTFEQILHNTPFRKYLNPFRIQIKYQMFIFYFNTDDKVYFYR